MQSTRLVAAVVELGSLVGIEHYDKKSGLHFDLDSGLFLCAADDSWFYFRFAPSFKYGDVVHAHFSRVGCHRIIFEPSREAARNVEGMILFTLLLPNPSRGCVKTPGREKTSHAFDL